MMVGPEFCNMSNTIVKTKTHTSCPYLVLGLRKGAPFLQVEQAYQSLVAALDEDLFLHSPQAWVQAGHALLEVEDAYQRILNNDLDDGALGVDEEPFWPKLGQILVWSGKLDILDLYEAIHEQEKARRPLGEILTERGLLNQDELAAFLCSQNALQLPPDSPYELGLRLIALCLVPEDLVCIALIEYSQSRTPIEKTLIKRGWLSAEVLEAVLSCLPDQRAIMV